MRWTPSAQPVLSLLFFGSLVLVLLLVAWRLRGFVPAAAAVALVATQADVIHAAPGQLSDIPLATLITLSAGIGIMALERGLGTGPWNGALERGLGNGALERGLGTGPWNGALERGRRANSLIALSGLCACLAAWTKDEGIAFAVVWCIGLGLAARFQRARVGRHPTGLLLLLGTPVLLAVFAAKFGLVSTSVLEDVKSVGQPENQPWSVARQSQILESYIRVFFGSLDWPVAIVATVGLLLGAGRHLVCRRLVPGRILIWISVIGLVGATFAALQSSPHNIEWHLRTSTRRLVVQWLPLIALAITVTLTGPSRRSGLGRRPTDGAGA